MLKQSTQLPLPPGENPASPNAGSALIVVLWVIGLLSILISSFAFDMHVEAKLASYQKKRTEAAYLALAGIERAQWFLSRSKFATEAYEGEYGEEWWWGQAERLSRGGAFQFEESLGAGTVRLEITAEPARRNVNLLTDEEWENIFEMVAVGEELWPDLIASIRDWIDADEDTRPEGAETDDYYKTLENPYAAKNSPLDTVQELNLIKGFHPRHESDSDRPEEEQTYVVIGAFSDLLTVYGDGKVNVNSASPRVLMTLPGMTELTASDIQLEREGGYLDAPTEEDTSFESIGDLYSRVPDMPANIQDRLTIGASIFRIHAVGEVGGVERKIWCIANATPTGMRVLRWLEQEDI